MVTKMIDKLLKISIKNQAKKYLKKPTKLKEKTGRKLISMVI